MRIRNLSALLGSVVSFVVPFSSADAVQDGFFIGASVGQGQVQANVEDPVIPDPPKFDETD